MTIRDQAYQRKPLDVFIIDAHTHITPYYKSGWHQPPERTTLKAFIDTYDRLGIDCVTAPHALVDAMTTEANQAAADGISGRIYGYISVAPFGGLSVLIKPVPLRQTRRLWGSSFRRLQWRLYRSIYHMPPTLPTKPARATIHGRILRRW